MGMGTRAEEEEDDLISQGAVRKEGFFCLFFVAFMCE